MALKNNSKGVETLCSFSGGNQEDKTDGDLAVEINVGAHFFWARLETAAYLICVGEGLFLDSGGLVISENYHDVAADGTPQVYQRQQHAQGVHVVCTGTMRFTSWGETFHEEVQIMTDYHQRY